MSDLSFLLEPYRTSIMKKMDSRVLLSICHEHYDNINRNENNFILHFIQYDNKNHNYDYYIILTINNQVNIGYAHFIISDLNNDSFIKDMDLSYLDIKERFQGKGYGTFLLKRCLLYIYNFNEYNKNNNYFIRGIHLEDASDSSYGGRIYLNEGLEYKEFRIENINGNNIIRPLDGEMSLNIYNKDNVHGIRSKSTQVKNNFIINFKNRYNLIDSICSFENRYYSKYLKYKNKYFKLKKFSKLA
jgi:hypothetical protein